MLHPFSNFLYPRHKSLWVICILTLSLLFSRCSEVSQHTESDDKHVDSIIDRTNTLLNSGKITESLAFLDSAYKGIDNPSDLDLWKKYNHKSIFYLNYRYNLALARVYVDSMKLVINEQKNKHKEFYAETLFKEGDVLIAENLFDRAFSSYFEGRKFAEKNLDTCKLARFTEQLGLVRFQQGQFMKAVPYLKQALRENSSCPEESGFYNIFYFRQHALNTLALCFEHTKRPDSAVFYYQATLDYITKNRHKYTGEQQFIQMSTGVLKGNLGGSYMALKDYKQAEINLKESIKINQQPGYDIQDAQTAKLKLIGLYTDLGRNNEASKLLDEIKAFLESSEKTPYHTKIMTRWYGAKANFYEHTGNEKRALAFQRAYYAAKDSVSVLGSELKVADIDIVFRQKEQQYKLALITKSSELKTGYLIAACIFSLLIAGILSTVLINLRRMKKINLKISENNKKLETALMELEDSQHKNSHMMQIMAHDLRNPISATISITGLLLDNEDLDAGDRQMLELMNATNNYTLEMISGLLDMDNGAQPMKTETVELDKLLETCAEILQFKALGKEQQISLSTVPAVVQVNREKMWRVINNLIVNAMKFSPTGTTIAVELASSADFVQFSICDKGIGIPAELKDNIFDMFTTAKRPGTSGEKSFGLGLAICKQIVEAHHGEIWHENTPGGGTTFFVKLPRV